MVKVHTCLLSHAKSDLELAACFWVFRELRPHLSREETFISQVRRQHISSGYDISVVKINDSVVSAMGFRIGEFLAWGKILYIDDLVSLPAYRDQGCAAKLLAWGEDYAKENVCKAIHLDSGYSRKNAHRLYLNAGFSMVSHHFQKNLDGD